MKINEHGLAMTTYNYSFWQRFDKTDPLEGKMLVSFRCRVNGSRKGPEVFPAKTPMTISWFRCSQRLDALFACEPEEEFTTTKYFKSHDEYYEILNARMKKAYPVILDCIKTVSPAKRGMGRSFKGRKKQI